MHLKISSVKWRPFCPGGDGLNGCYWWLEEALERLQLYHQVFFKFHKTDHRIILMMTASSSLVTLEAVKLTASNATSDDEAVTMTTTFYLVSNPNTLCACSRLLYVHQVCHLSPRHSCFHSDMSDVGPLPESRTAPGPVQLFWQHWGFDLIF